MNINGYTVTNTEQGLKTIMPVDDYNALISSRATWDYSTITVNNESADNIYISTNWVTCIRLIPWASYGLDTVQSLKDARLVSEWVSSSPVFISN